MPAHQQQTTKMAAYLICVTTEGGVPIFTRKKGDLKSLPFALVGSLNGVHMFARNHGVSMLQSHSKDARIVWKDYHNSLTLILVCNEEQCSEVHAERVLDTVFYGLVLLLGLEELVNSKNVERLKRDIRGCNWLVDDILEQADNAGGTFGDITLTVDCILCPEYLALQSHLDTFVESEDSLYGCLLIHGKVAVATSKWWTFTGEELALLNLFISRTPRSTCADIPIFLPIGSPNVPHRLIILQLLPGVEVCLLCGPSPTLAEIEKDIGRIWRGAYETLRSAEQTHPRNFPSTFTVDRNIIGFLLVHLEKRRCLSYFQPVEDHLKPEVKTATAKKREEILRSFYRSVVGTIFPPHSLHDKVEDRSEVFHTRLKHTGLDTYVCGDQHKCYAMETATHQIFVMYHMAVPTFALRATTQRTLQTLIKDKHVHL